jgi:YegS/Rv2252/BmrU family lipid kinase
MERVLFLFNSHAGKGRIKGSLSDIIELFVNADYEVTVHSTKGKGDAQAVAFERGEEYDIIVASGGDGTLNEVVNGIMPLNKKPNIGFIPVGTTNDFAMNFNLSKVNVNAAQSIVFGKPYAYDIGSFNDHYFNYVAAFGLFADVSYATPQAYKNLLGRLAYIAEGARSLAYIQSYHMKFSCGEMEIEDEFIFGSISNANTVGGFRNLTGKNVTLNDGLFEVILITKPKNLLELNSIINSLLLLNYDNKNIFKFKTNEIKYTSEKLVDWSLDGEFGGSLKSATIINHKQAVNFLVEESMIVELKESATSNLIYNDETILYNIDNELIDEISSKISLEYSDEEE